MSVLFSPPMRAMQMPGDVAFTVGDLTIYWYGILLSAAIIVLILLAGSEARRKRLPQDTAVDLCLIAIPCGVVGARLAYVAVNFSAYQSNLLDILRFWDGGLSALGAVAFALLGALVYARAKKIPFLRLLDTVAPGIAAAQAVVVWTDFFLQQRYGALVTNEKWMRFPFAVLIESSDSIHYAVFFYAFILLVLLFAFLWLILRKKATADGTVTGAYLALYAVCRILTDGLRPDEARPVGGLTTAQIVCFALLALGLVLLFTRRTKRQAVAAASPGEDTEPAAATVEADAAPEIFAELPIAHTASKSHTNTDAPVPETRAAERSPEPNTQEQE